MANAVLVLPDDSANAGKKLDAESLTVAAQTVYRERLQISGAADDEIARVLDEEPASDAMALAVRLVPITTALPISSSALGATNDAGVTGDQDGSVIAHLRGLNTILADVWSSGGNYLAVNFTNTTIAVTQGTAANLNATVVGTGTFAAQIDGAALTALQLIDDVVYVDDADWTDNTSKHALVGGVYQSSPHTVTDGDVTPFLTDVNGRLAVVVNGTVAVTQSGTWNVGTVSTVTTVTTVSTVSAVTAVGTITPGFAATSLGKREDDAFAGQDVGVMAMVVANEANTQFAADGDYIPIGTNREGSLRILGTRAHDAVDADGPVKIGYVAIAHGTNPTAVAAADRTNAYANRAGVPFTIGGHPNVQTHSVRISDAAGAQTDTAFFTVAGGLKVVVTRVSMTADASNSGPINITVGFGTSTLTTPDTTTAGTGILADFQGVPAGGGMVVGDGSGILGVGADGAEVRYTCEDPAGGAATVTISYYTVES